jgi:transposase-like protein
MTKKSKAEAVTEMLKAGQSVAFINEMLGVSGSYIYMLKKKLAEGAEEAVETVRQTATEHTSKIKEMIEDWRAEAEVDNAVDTILDERAATYGSFEDVAGCAQEIKNAIRICNNSELDDDQIEALDMIASKIARVVNGNPNHIDSWIDIAGYATLVADRLQGKTR